MITKMININKVIEKLSYTRPLEGGDNTKERYRHMQWLSDTNAIKEIKPNNAIIVPDGATNGDIIKAIFPNIEAREKAFEIEVNVNKNKVGNISKELWNSPFKNEVEG